MASKQVQRQRREATEETQGTAQQVASQAKEQVQEKADEARGRASERLRDQLDRQSTTLGERVGPFADALRKAADHLESEGSAPGAKAARDSADRVDRLSRYLTSSRSDRLLADLERFARRRPWAAGGIGGAFGFVAARFLKASSEGRYEAAGGRGPSGLSSARGAARALPEARRDAGKGSGAR